MVYKMTTIKVHNAFSYFSMNISEAKLKVINEAVSYLVADTFWIRKRTGRFVPEKISMLKKHYNKDKKFCGYYFPTGLLDDVCNVLADVYVEDKRDYSDAPTTMPDFQQFVCSDIQLRKDQLWCLKKMYKHHNGILSAPTGGGKSAIASTFIKAYDLPTVVLIPSKELLHQTRSMYARYMEVDEDEIGFIGDGVFEPRKFNVVSVPTLRERVEFLRYGKVSCPDNDLKKLIKETRVLISDEAHRVGKNTFYDCAVLFRNAAYRFGMSATPWSRADKISIMLKGSFGPTIAEVTPDVLMTAGIIAIPDIIMYRPGGVKLNGRLKWAEAYSTGIVFNDRRNAIIIELIKKHLGQKQLVLFERKNHGLTLSRLLDHEGIKHRLLWGDVDGKERAAAREEFKNGDLDIIIGSKIFETGVDLPDLAVLIRADGYKAETKVIQGAGRALRATDTKKRAIIYDFYDDHQRILEKHSAARLHCYKDYYTLANIETIDYETGKHFILTKGRR